MAEDKYRFGRQHCSHPWEDINQCMMRIGQKASYPAVGADCRNRLSYVRPNRYEVCLCWCTVAPNREPTFLFLPNLFTPPPLFAFSSSCTQRESRENFLSPPRPPPSKGNNGPCGSGRACLMCNTSLMLGNEWWFQWMRWFACQSTVEFSVPRLRHVKAVALFHVEKMNPNR